MTNREYRKKAQEIFNDTSFVFVGKASFEKAFPEVEECLVEVKERGPGVSNWPTATVRHRNPGEYINCSNPLCYNGGFRVGSDIREMVSKRETQREGSKICQGNEGSPKGRRVYRKCTNYFRYKITVKYKPESAQGKIKP